MQDQVANSPALVSHSGFDTLKGLRGIAAEKVWTLSLQEPRPGQVSLAYRSPACLLKASFPWKGSPSHSAALARPGSVVPASQAEVMTIKAAIAQGSILTGNAPWASVHRRTQPSSSSYLRRATAKAWSVRFGHKQGRTSRSASQRVDGK